MSARMLAITTQNTARRQTMEIMRVLRLGQNGIKQLLKEYGDNLQCVRYRYNYQTRKRYKTIELVISEQDRQPHGGSRPLAKR
jgi:hypothetical protein